MGIIFISLLFASLHVQGYYYDVGVKITFSDVVIFLWFMYSLFSMSLFKLKIFSNHIYSLPILFSFLFLLWNGFAAIISSMPEEGATLFLQVVRNYLLFLLLINSLKKIQDYEKINLYFFLIGILSSIIGIALFYKGLLNINIILSNPELWNYQIGWELDKSGYLRANGLVGDSNFYAIFLTMALLCGIEVKLARLIKYPGILTIFIAILLAFSRSLIVALFISPLLMLFLRLRQLDRKIFVQILLVLMFFSVSFLIILFIFDINFIDVMEERFSDISGTKREAMWNILTPMIAESPLWGHGLRAAQKTLHFYSHNTYLDLLVDTGMIGMVLFLLILFSLYLFLLDMQKNKQLHNNISKSLVPWKYMCVIIPQFIFFFSFGTNPFIWLVFGMILASYVLKKEFNEQYITTSC